MQLNAFISEGDEDDLGTFNFGMSLTSAAPGSALSPHSFHEQHQTNMDIDNTVNDNFVIGPSGSRSDSRQKSRYSTFSELDENFDSVSRSSNGGRPVGVVQPQMSSLRDGYRVLPSDVQLDKSNLRPTAVNIKAKHYNEVSATATNAIH